MTVVQWSDGNILTAGSLRLVPQLYISQNPNVTTTVTGTPTAIGSIFVSGGLFSESLLYSFSANSNNGNRITYSVVVSGAGLGGGSTVLTWGVGAPGSGAMAHTNVTIGSNAGWIPGSAAVIIVNASGPGGNTDVVFLNQTVLGTGRP